MPGEYSGDVVRMLFHFTVSRGSQKGYVKIDMVVRVKQKEKVDQ